MKKYNLFSNFADEIQKFIEYKNCLGYPYEDSSRILWNFDIFCLEHFPDKTELDNELGMRWLDKKESESQAGHRNRVMVIREFAKYLQSKGKSAYIIPISLTKRPRRYTPHIFTQEELTAFFHAADRLEFHKKAPARHLVVPVFFRLLYCCGLRPSEARLLLNENIDLTRGILKIVESKGHKDRLVALSEDMILLMKNYGQQINCIFTDCPYTFPRYDGNGAYTKLWTEEMFWRCFTAAGINTFYGTKPRVYDFRHTFATACIYRWVREGKDADAMLPYLSAYMGHTQLDDTAYYIHLVPEAVKSLSKSGMDFCEALLPEVPYEN